MASAMDFVESSFATGLSVLVWHQAAAQRTPAPLTPR